MEDKKIKAIVNVLSNLNDDEVISLWNEFCEGDDYIYANDEEFFDLFETKMDAVRSAIFGHYNLSDEYVVFNGYANLDSFDFISDGYCPIDLDTLAERIVRNGETDILGVISEDDIKDEFLSLSELVDCKDAEAAYERCDNENGIDILGDDWDELIEQIKAADNEEEEVD